MGTRDRILDAAAELMRTRGIVRTTTKEIAKAAGFSEATLYKHFRDKEELLLRVLGERMPGFGGNLRPTAGTGDLEDNVFRLVRGALDFYRETFPMLGSLLAEPQLTAAHGASIGRYGGGPQHAVERIAAYLRAEQGLGRVAADADPDAAAALLTGACFQQAFLRYFAEGPSAAPAPDALATDLTRALLRTLTA